MHPDARWGTNGLSRQNTYYPLLQPDSTASTGTTAIWFTVWFIHPTEDLSLIQVVADDPYLGRTFDPEVDLSDVVVKIQFTTANGVRWEVPTKAETSGDPVRLS